jgi:chromosome segregation protein
MHLEKIDIQGFKSFANKETLIFPSPEKDNKGITAVVGPNGAGKSNVVDAVRWVLGEQSLKLLRGKKSEDVIFHGSTDRSRLGMAEVTLHINNHDKVIPIEYSEIMLTRRIYRNGESEYLINKGKAKLSEIIMLLAKANFGQKSFSIVGQGMIDYILQAGVKERKDFFDEAVGVKQYQIKRHQTINNLNRTGVNLGQIHITLKELEPRVRLLSRQAKKLEKRQELKKKLTDLQIAYYSNLYFKLNNNIKRVNNDLGGKNKDDKEISEGLLELQKKLAVFAKESDRDEIFNKLKDEFDLYNDKKNNLVKELNFLKGEINIEYKKEGKLDLAWITQSKDELKTGIYKITKELEYLKGEETSTNKKLKSANYSLQEVNKKLNDIKKHIELSSNKTTASVDKDWKKLIEKIINDQQKLIESLEIAEKKEDFIKLKESALQIKSLLKQLKDGENKDNQGKDAKEKIYLAELTESQNNLIDSKNNFSIDINSLEIKLNITKEKIKMASTRLTEKEDELKKINKELSVNEFRDKNEKLKEYQKKEKYTEKQLEEIEDKSKDIKNKLDNFNKTEQEKKDRVFSLQDKIQEQQLRLSRSKGKINELLIELTKYETKKEDLTREVREELESTNKLDKNKLGEEVDLDKIYKLKKQLELIGGIDPETITEYKETKERYEFLVNQVEDLEQTSEKLDKIIADLDKIIKKQFDESFGKINNKFNSYFKVLFDGGEAKLIKSFRKIKETEIEINEETGEEEEKEILIRQEMEIEIQAAPHGKKLKDIHILSGGEKSLTSIALICAIISINPSPFVILDEVDAALDEANSIRFSDILRDLSNKTQFITITHNRATMEVAKILYGVTMQEKGISKVLSIGLEDAKAKAAR